MGFLDNFGANERAVIKGARWHFAIALFTAATACAVVIYTIEEWRYGRQIGEQEQTIAQQDRTLADYRQKEQVAASKPAPTCPAAPVSTCPEAPKAVDPTPKVRHKITAATEPPSAPDGGGTIRNISSNQGIITNNQSGGTNTLVVPTKPDRVLDSQAATQLLTLLKSKGATKINISILAGIGIDERMQFGNQVKDFLTANGYPDPGIETIMPVSGPDWKPASVHVYENGTADIQIGANR